MLKSEALDKHDAHIVEQKQFIHKDYGVSGVQLNFSVQNAHIFGGQRRRHFICGVNKKLYHASGAGYYIDSSHIGKD